MARILIADDAPFFRTMIKEVLEIEGHEILFAEDGEQAVTIAKRESPNLDLLILDMVLPKKTGLEVLMDLSDLELKIICVTGNDLVAEIDELKELGALDVVNKSTPVEKIFYRINQLLFDEQKAEQKRQHLRAQVNIQIQVHTDTASFTSNTFTLSQEGVFIETEEILPENTEVKLFFYLPLSKESGKEVDCLGKVIWVCKGEEPGKVKGVGVTFSNLSDFDRQMIQDFVESIAEIESIT